MRVLRGLRGHVLPCGCLVGVYETYDGRVVASIDAPGPDCSAHRRHEAVPCPSRTSGLALATVAHTPDSSTRVVGNQQ